MAYGFGKKVIVRDMNGQIAPETLKQIVNWQWPVNSIQLKDIQFNYKKSKALRQLMGNCIGVVERSFIILVIVKIV